MIRILVLITITTLLTSWTTDLLYEQYHGGGFAAWIQWHRGYVINRWPWWILVAWALSRMSFR